MSPEITFLIAVLHGDRILWVALKIPDRNAIDLDYDEYPMEPMARAYYLKLLPTHLQEGGKIVEIRQIDDAVVIAP